MTDSNHLGSNGVSLMTDDDDLSSVEVHHKLFDSCAADEADDEFFDEDDEFITEVHFDPLHVKCLPVNADAAVSDSIDRTVLNADIIEVSRQQLSNSQLDCSGTSEGTGAASKAPFSTVEQIVSSAVALLDHAGGDQKQPSASAPLATCDQPDTLLTCNVGSEAVCDTNHLPASESNSCAEQHSIKNLAPSEDNSLPPKVIIDELSNLSQKKRSTSNKHSAVKTLQNPKHEQPIPPSTTSEFDIDETLKFINGDISKLSRESHKCGKSTRAGKGGGKTKSTKQPNCNGGDSVTSEDSHHSSVVSPDDVADCASSPDDVSPMIEVKSKHSKDTVENSQMSECVLGEIPSTSQSSSSNDLNTADGEFTDVVRRKRKDAGFGRQKEQLPSFSSVTEPQPPRSSNKVGNNVSKTESRLSVTKASSSLSTTIHHCQQNAPVELKTQVTVSQPDNHLDVDRLAAFPALPSHPLRRNSTGNLAGISDSTVSYSSNGSVESVPSELAQRPAYFQAPITSSYASIVVRTLPKPVPVKTKPESSCDINRSRTEDTMPPSDEPTMVLNTATTDDKSADSFHSIDAIITDVVNELPPPTVSNGKCSSDDLLDVGLSASASSTSATEISSTVLTTSSTCSNDSSNAVSCAMSNLPSNLVSDNLSLAPAAADDLPHFHDHEDILPTSVAQRDPKPATVIRDGGGDSFVFFDTRTKNNPAGLSHDFNVTFGYDASFDSAGDSSRISLCNRNIVASSEHPMVFDFLQLSTIDQPTPTPASSACTISSQPNPCGSFDLSAAQRYLMSAFNDTLKLKENGSNVVLQYGADLQ